MEDEIDRNNFLEFGEHNGNLYGTHLDSIRNVIKDGKMCILDCSPAVLKFLHNSPEFMPFVIFVSFILEFNFVLNLKRRHIDSLTGRRTGNGPVETFVRRTTSSWWITEKLGCKLNVC